MEVTLLYARIGNGEGGDDALAITEEYAVEVAYLLDGALPFGKLIKHLSPNVVRNDNHWVGPR